jgi:poly(3-hydroxybutyrate) depolymerase
MQRLVAFSIILAVGFMANIASAAEFKSLDLGGGRELVYAVVVPADYDRARDYPAILAMPPGPQTPQMVEAGLGLYWEAMARERGFLVFSPVAPGGTTFYRGSEKLIPKFLSHIKKTYRIRGGKFYLTGISNGGISAFRLAVNQPDAFHSLTVVPGYPISKADFQGLEKLKSLSVSMYVGEQDTRWHAPMNKALQRLQSLGIAASLKVIPGEGHVIQSLRGPEAAEFFDKFGQ